MLNFADLNYIDLKNTFSKIFLNLDKKYINAV